MKLLEKHFDLAFAAPDGIQRLRELILTLAMQGKLVPQDPKDQPASELLKAIEAEKQRLVKEGKIKQPKPLPEIKPDEVPYELPQGWVWVRLGNISQIIGGFAYKSGCFQTESTKQVLRLGNIRPDAIRLNENPVFIDDALGEATSEFCLLKNDILITMTGTRSKRDYLYTVRVEENPMNGVLLYINQRVGAIRLFFDSRYVNLALKVETLKDVIFSSATGSANQANIGISNLREWMMPLPPLAEQRRIVAKIDQLMARCDELEKLRGDRNQKRITIHTAALDRLLTAKESSDFSTAWRFITQHFGELYSVKENVAELRKAILQLAVMGKLVPQDPKDEPASELLKAIEAEKQRLVKEGKIKQSKPLPEIKPQQVPYELPKGWNWVRLGDISQIIGGFAYKSNLFKTEGTRQVLRLGNIRPDLIRLNENPVFIDDSLGELTSELCLLKNDILITMTGTRSKHDYLYTVRVEENPMNGVLLYLNQRVGAIRLFSDARYMNLALKVEILKDAIFSSATGSANQANIGINNLREWIVPLPPLTEQHRIIAKTDRIMALCDQLDEQIDAATSKQTTLLNAVMTQV